MQLDPTTPQVNGWRPIDNGIDPRQGIFDNPRQNDSFDQPSCISTLANAIFCLTFPISCCCGWRTVKPMTDTIVTRCGILKDVFREPGLYFFNPCCTDTREVYMGLNDIEISKMAANDSHRSPIVITAQFVYHIIDSVSASYKTSDLTKFLKEQGESALRAVAGQYPYDSERSHTECLGRHSITIENRLKEVFQEMISLTGVKIDTFRLITVAYDPKMEKLLLARQEAQAEVTAQETIADGAAGIVQGTVSRLSALGIKLSEIELNRFATNLTMLLVNHGHVTLNLFESTPPQTLRSDFIQQPLTVKQKI